MPTSKDNRTPTGALAEILSAMGYERMARDVRKVHDPAALRRYVEAARNFASRRGLSEPLKLKVLNALARFEGMLERGDFGTSRINPGHWIQGSIKRPGALHRKLGIPEGQDIPISLLREAKAHPERWEKTHTAQVRLEREANEALVLRGLHHHHGPERNPKNLLNEYSYFRTKAEAVRAARRQSEKHGEPIEVFAVTTGNGEHKFAAGTLGVVPSGYEFKHLETVNPHRHNPGASQAQKDRIKEQLRRLHIGSRFSGASAVPALRSIADRFPSVAKWLNSLQYEDAQAIWGELADTPYTGIRHNPGGILRTGTRVTWHYRSAIGHGIIKGIHKRGTTHANTEYSIRELDHHPGEPAIVYHYGRALTVEREADRHNPTSLSAFEAKQVLERFGNKDFYELDHNEVDELLKIAKQVGYRPPTAKYRSASPARYFYQHLERLASRHSRKHNPLHEFSGSDSEHYGEYVRGKTGRATVSSVSGFGYNWEVTGRTKEGEYFTRGFRNLEDARAAAKRVAEGGYYEPERRRKRNPLELSPAAQKQQLANTRRALAEAKAALERARYLARAVKHRPLTDRTNEVLEAEGRVRDIERELSRMQRRNPDAAAELADKLKQIDEEVARQSDRKACRRWLRSHPSAGVQDAISACVIMPMIERDRRRSRKRNPDASAEGERLYESFHGEPSDELILEHAPAGTSPSTVTALGELVELVLTSGTKLDFDGKHFLLTSNPAGTQLYITGRVDFTKDQLAEFDCTKDFIDLGSIKTVTYRTEKGFDDFKTYEYIHKLGEDSGDRPCLIYDRRNHRLQFAGGNYQVRPEGIVD